MADLIHISAIEKYFSKIMKMDKYKVRETVKYIQRINKICPNCNYDISKPEHSYEIKPEYSYEVYIPNCKDNISDSIYFCKGIKDAYYSDKYKLLFCDRDCADSYNQEICVICKINSTVVNCELCNFSLCEECHKTDDKCSWYCEDCYTIKKCNEESDDDNDDYTDDDDDDDEDDDEDNDEDDEDDEDYLPCELCDKKSYDNYTRCMMCEHLICYDCSVFCDTCAGSKCIPCIDYYCEECECISDNNNTDDNNDDDDDTDDNTCTLCEKQFDYIDLNKCDKCIEIFCDKCFYGYTKRDSNGKVIDYEIGHEC